jgi:hypothetical protein
VGWEDSSPNFKQHLGVTLHCNTGRNFFKISFVFKRQIQILKRKKFEFKKFEFCLAQKGKKIPSFFGHPGD